MAVHDVGGYRQAPLKPGQVFAVDPQLWVPEEKLYIRYEDTVVVTETGVENFTAFLPSELDAIEAVVRGKGVLQSLPALTEAGFDALRREALTCGARRRSCSRSAAARSAWADTYPRQPGIDVLHYPFRLTLADDSDAIEGEATVSVRCGRGVGAVSLDLRSRRPRRPAAA